MSANYYLPVKKTLVIRATLLDTYGNQIQGPVAWSSDDSGAYVTLNPGLANGYSNHYVCAVVGVAAGTANITATSGVTTQTYQVTVYSQTIASITIGLN